MRRRLLAVVLTGLLSAGLSTTSVGAAAEVTHVESELIALGTTAVETADGAEARASVLSYRADGAVRIRVAICANAATCETYDSLSADASVTVTADGRHAYLTGEVDGLGPVNLSWDAYSPDAFQTCSSPTTRTSYLAAGDPATDGTVDRGGQLGPWKTTVTGCAAFVQAGTVGWVGP